MAGHGIYFQAKTLPNGRGIEGEPMIESPSKFEREQTEAFIAERQKIFERGKACGCEIALLAINQNPIIKALDIIKNVYIESESKSKEPIQDSPAEWAKGNR